MKVKERIETGCIGFLYGGHINVDYLAMTENNKVIVKIYFNTLLRDDKEYHFSTWGKAHDFIKNYTL